jgi:chemotaxis protein methyltransferase CheR
MTAISSALGSATAPSASGMQQLIQIRDLIYRVAGIFHADNKLRLMEDRCQKRMTALGVSNLRDYYDCLTIKPIRQAELVSLLNEITIGETCFFRNRPQIDAIRKIVLPKLIEAKNKLGLQKLLIWSAGCSTGEEPYTLSMLLMEEAQGPLKGWIIEILATDLNERSIAHAKAASYGDYSIRNVEPYFRNKYFTVHGDKLKVKPEVQQNVTFSRLNLLDDARVMFMKGVDLILCCNVLIYFDATSKKRVIQHFYTNLNPHGYLFLGHSESLFGVTEEFRLVHMPSATAYVKSEKRLVEKAR